MNRRRLISLTLCIAALTLLNAGPALAAAPSNDNFANATTVTEPLPVTDSISTIDATTEATDPVPDCSGSVSHTVWYSYTPSADGLVQADTLGSDYDTVVSVWTGTAGSLSQVGCNDDFGGIGGPSQLTFSATGGTTYYLMVGSFVGPFGGDVGGNLQFSVSVGLPPLLQAFSVDSRDKVAPRTGIVTLSGTVTCSREGSVSIFAFVSQRVGRVLISGAGFTGVDCSGVTRWTMTISGDNGLFAGGRANVGASVFAPDSYLEVQKTVNLRG
jgi:hypothetical protein